MNTNLSDIGDDLERIRTSESYNIQLQANDSSWKFSIPYLSTSEASNEARSRIITSVAEWSLMEITEHWLKQT